MPDIKILDCTLRDGGYTNNWNFGKENISKIINNLNDAQIDYIEAGFITTKSSSNNQTLFNSFAQLNNYLPKNNEKLIIMIKPEDFPIDYIDDAKTSKIKNIRVIFKKHQTDEALDYCKKIKNKGYKLFINPTFINLYTENELNSILSKINKIEPYALSIVDSTGSLRRDDLFKLHKIIQNSIKSDISLCFHSHNNLGLSFSNVCYFLELFKNRKLIIDSSILGMGRGAGNIKTEILSDYLNKNFNKNYNVDLLLNLTRLLSYEPVGISLCYYLTAINNCHPDYAKFIHNFVNNNNAEFINNMLKLIPKSHKYIYDEKLINEICKTT